LRLDDDGIDAGVHECGGLLEKGVTDLGLGELAVRFHEPPEWADVADDVPRPAAERLPRNSGPGLVDLPHVGRVPVAVEHDARSAEGVGQDAVGTSLRVTLLDREDPFGMREVPCFAALPLLQPGEHELRAHGAVADEGM
jgi:hypothetical protein